MTDVIVITQTHDILGESPIWCERESLLYWIDIRGKSLRRWNPMTDETKSWFFPELVGSFALCESGSILIALQLRLAFFDPSTGSLETLVTMPPPNEGMRFNDGKCDRQGRFWVGSKYDPAREPRGALYRFDPNGTLSSHLTDIGIPNGLAWSPDNKVMYFADSALGEIYRYPFDPATGALGAKSLFAKSAWTPDGATVDSEGFLWSAEYDGWRVVRYDPDGRIDREIKLPVQRPTSCSFGGPKLDRLFITTARQRIPEQEIAKQPLAGAVLAFDAGVRGLPEPRFAR